MPHAYLYVIRQEVYLGSEEPSDYKQCPTLRKPLRQEPDHPIQRERYPIQESCLGLQGISPDRFNHWSFHCMWFITFYAISLGKEHRESLFLQFLCQL